MAATGDLEPPSELSQRILNQAGSEFDLVRLFPSFYLPAAAVTTREQSLQQQLDAVEPFFFPTHLFLPMLFKHFCRLVSVIQFPSFCTHLENLKQKSLHVSSISLNGITLI